MTATEQEKVSLRTKILYGAGEFGFSAANSIMGIVFGIYLTDMIGLDPGLAAAAVFLGRSWDYINDPIIGHLSDRTRTRWGRRRPFLLFGFLPFALTFAALWWKPPISTAWGLVIYYALAYVIYDASATLVYMPYYALTPELTPDYDERTTLTSYRMAFGIIGGLVAFTVPMMIIGTMRPENQGRASLMGLTLGLVCATPLLLSFWGTRERTEYQAQEQPRLKDSLRAALRNKPFLFAMGIFFFTWAALEICQAMLLYFIKYRLHMEAHSDTIPATIFITALITLPFWDRISRRWDKRIAYIVGMVFVSGVILTMIAATPAWSLPVVFTLAALAGIGVGAMHVLPWAMIPDAVEWDELHTGQRHEGMFYSLVALFRKIAASVALPMILLVLRWSGYVANAPEQSASTVRAIQALTGAVPSVLLFTGIAFAIRYPLSRERHAQVRAELASRRQSDVPIRD